MAQTLQSLYAIPTVVPQLGINNTFTGINTFSGNLVSSALSIISNHGTPYALTDPGSVTGNWYTLGTVTFGAQGSAIRLEINGSASYTTGAQIAGHDVIELRMGNNTSGSTAPNITGNYYRIGDRGSSPIVANTLKCVSVNSSVTDNSYTIWYQSNTFTKTSRVYVQGQDATFVFSGAYQSSGDPSGTVSNPALYLYVVPYTVSLRASVINTIGRTLINGPADDGTSALIVSGASTLGATTINGTLNVNNTSVFAVSGSEYDMFFQTGGSLANRIYFACAAATFSVAYTDSSGNYAGAALQINRSTGAVVVPTTLTSTNLTVGSNTATAAQVIHNSAAGNNRTIFWQTAGSSRWALFANTAAETGSNVGSDFFLNRYDDTGTVIDQPFTVTRSTGRVTLGSTGGLQVTGSSTFSGNLTLSGTVVLNGTIAASVTINANASAALYATWPVATGTIANGGGGGNYSVILHANNNGGSTATSAAALTFIRDGIFGCYFGLDTDNNLKVGGWSAGNVAYQVFHSGVGAWIPQTYLNYNSTGGSLLGIGTSGIGGAGIWNDNGTYKTLMVIGNNTAGSGRSVSIWDYLTVNGTITSAGNLQCNGTQLYFNGAMYVLANGNYRGIQPVGTVANFTTAFNPGYMGAGNGDNAAQTANNMAILSWNGVGIGPSISGQGVPLGQYSHWFDVRGGNMTQVGTHYAANFIINSDMRFKEQIRLLDGEEELDKIMSLIPRLYDKQWGGREHGFYAQDIKLVYPEAISYQELHGIKDFHFFDTNQLHAPHIAATQELYRKIQRLEARVRELESR